MCDLRKLETDQCVISDNNWPDRRFRLVLTWREEYTVREHHLPDYSRWWCRLQCSQVFHSGWDKGAGSHHNRRGLSAQRLAWRHGPKIDQTS